MCAGFKAGLHGAETARIELEKNQKIRDDCPKNDFNFAGNFLESTI